APQPPAAPSAGNGVAAAPIPVAGSSSPPATANQGELSKEGPVAQGESAAPTSSASAEDRLPTTAGESADRPRVGSPSPQPCAQEACRPSNAGAPPAPTGRPGGDPPTGIGGSERASADWSTRLPRVRSATNPPDRFASAAADGLTDDTATLAG